MLLRRAHILKCSSTKYINFGRLGWRRLFSKKPGSSEKFDTRKEVFESLKMPMYPSISDTKKITAISKLRSWDNILLPDARQYNEAYTVCGRISNLRYASSKLAFIDVCDGLFKIQLTISKNNITDNTSQSLAFSHIIKAFRRGDYIQCSGFIGKTSKGELSIYATELPILLSPCLHQMPTNLLNQEKRFQQRYVDIVANPDTLCVLKKRFQIIECIRNFFQKNEFTEVETPMLSHHFGGAMARPFITNDAQKQPLSLRCAPELWLKQLVIGGMHRIFELGKNFRNEGLDATHNPEFTSCEAYCAFINLNTFIEMTKGLLREICMNVHGNMSLPHLGVSLESDSFQTLEFIPSLEKSLNQSLGTINNSEEYREFLLDIYEQRNFKLPKTPTVSHLLDKLFDYCVLEHLSDGPTFIIHHPETMSPLAKSETIKYGETEYRVSKRFELYLGKSEICNAYEEENDPMSQKKKFESQHYDRTELGDQETPIPDADFVRALEYGLPPTTGWGMGVDRLVMLLTGQKRINEVLPFGSLRYI
ncbi:lysine-tRNA ligase [Schizosaccharomyces cryophilus OY26]|uniref:Lysine--tRNA ligase n=1 Tax=Schizosaccharomyces cryophilus (strain OY26 / ATCC MYA-4695 / CBS 11777 / NBRC 106824 / NRRL Y48691) TaxID=653667 RepID=S9VZJ8_SCHCR|nr:lysine-tRNA ligase [Schizosaccharomyces cryophilus OY26]EPY51230.1 lysine-tRNA ligase [Schizosaccharomyces cryophilus OY26]